MKLKKPLPPLRTLEQVSNHYLVEKALADHLKAATKEERRTIYAGMYDELFKKVPDHPRLTRRESPELTRRAIASRHRLLRAHLHDWTVLAEFGPGDCQCLVHLARQIRFAYGIDIADQRSSSLHCPDNVRLIVYDGYDTHGIADESVDVVFSDQLIEHIHPDETKDHFSLAKRLLKKGGKYIFRTPHRFTGPHDVSAHFCDEPQGFHLKEWTYREIRQLIRAAGFSRCAGYLSRRGFRLRVPFVYFVFLEVMLGACPRAVARHVSRLLIPTIVVVAEK